MLKVAFHITQLSKTSTKMIYFMPFQKKKKKTHKKYDHSNFILGNQDSESLSSLLRTTHQ